MSVLSAVGAELAGLHWLAAISIVLALGVLVVPVRAAEAAARRPLPLMLQGGLLLLVVAAVVQAQVWTSLRIGGTPAEEGLTASAEAQMWRRDQVAHDRWVLVLLLILILACCCFGDAIRRLPEHQLRQARRAAPLAGLLALGGGFVAMALCVELTTLFGWSVAVQLALIMLGGWAWAAWRVIRSYGAASVAIMGAGFLASAVLLAPTELGHRQPAPASAVVPPDPIGDGQVDFVMVVADPGSDVASVVLTVVAVVTSALIGSALITLSYPKLSTGM